MLTLLLASLIASAPPTLVVKKPRATPAVRAIGGLTAIAALGVSIGTTIHHYETNPQAVRGLAPFGIAGSFIPFAGSALAFIGDVELIPNDPHAAHRAIAHGLSFGFQVTGLVLLLLAPLFDRLPLPGFSVVPTARGMGLALSF